MSMATWFHKTAVVLACISVLTAGLPATWAVDAPLPRASQVLHVKPGNLNGKVLAADLSEVLVRSVANPRVLLT